MTEIAASIEDVKVETETAYLIHNGFDKEAWIPKSQVSDYRIKNGKIISIIISQQLAEKKGLI